MAPKPEAATSRDDPRQQVAALPWRLAPTGVEILLITSRGTKRWVIPKGWPMPGRRPHEAAQREAYEEAGVKGAIEPAPLGCYEYRKAAKNGALILCRVDVFPL
ncbi:MAG TPA: NUDIX hydrolase, partial [Beijerinckiaceae bacterium]